MWETDEDIDRENSNCKNKFKRGGVFVGRRGLEKEGRAEEASKWETQIAS